MSDEKTGVEWQEDWMNQWLYGEPAAPAVDPVDAERDALVAAFSGPNGKAALAYLRRRYIERNGCEFTDGALRMLEGARSVIWFIERIVKGETDGRN